MYDNEIEAAKKHMAALQVIGLSVSASVIGTLLSRIELLQRDLERRHTHDGS